MRIYSIQEISDILKKQGVEIIHSGTRRDWRNILLMPVKLIHNKIKYGYVMGSVFWDLLGFAEYVTAQKK